MTDLEKYNMRFEMNAVNTVIEDKDFASEV
jgi:uncharacterized protein YqgV (UPF0045/DUF77 family)